MKKLILVFTLLGIATAPLKAQTAAAPADAVYARVLNTEAMAWAWSIKKAKNISYQDLQNKSANWGRGEAVRGQLLVKVKDIIDNGQVRRLTTGEEAELAAAQAEARRLTSGAGSEKSAGQRSARQAAINGAAREMLDVEAKYWAWRIAVIRDVTFNEIKAKSEGWMRGAELTDELLAKVKVNLQSGETHEPSKGEQATMDACKKRIKQLVSRA